MNRIVGRNLAVSAAVMLFSLIAFAGTAQASFIDLGTGVIRDTHTNLQWEKDTSDSTFTWAGANAYGSALSLAGAGWRLASRNDFIQLYADVRADNLCIGGDCTGNRTPFVGVR